MRVSEEIKKRGGRKLNSRPGRPKRVHAFEDPPEWPAAQVKMGLKRGNKMAVPVDLSERVQVKKKMTKT